MMMIAQESGFRNAAKAKSSSAAGLGQFIDSTWDSMIKKYGKEHGIPPGAKKTDPRASAILSALYAKEGIDRAKKEKGYSTPTDAYLYYFLGGGASSEFNKLLANNPNAITVNASSRFKKVSLGRENHGFFYNSKFPDRSRPKTVQESYNEYGKKLRARGRELKIAYPEKDTGAPYTPFKSKKEGRPHITEMANQPPKAPSTKDPEYMAAKKALDDYEKNPSQHPDMKPEELSKHKAVIAKHKDNETSSSGGAPGLVGAAGPVGRPPTSSTISKPEGSHGRMVPPKRPAAMPFLNTSKPKPTREPFTVSPPADPMERESNLTGPDGTGGLSPVSVPRSTDPIERAQLETVGALGNANSTLNQQLSVQGQMLQVLQQLLDIGGMGGAGNDTAAGEDYNQRGGDNPYKGEKARVVAGQQNNQANQQPKRGMSADKIPKPATGDMLNP
jgi:hypothetical protein